MLSTIHDEDYRDRPVTVLDALFDPHTGGLLSAEPMKRGYIDTIDHVIDAKDGDRLIAHCQGRSLDYSRKNARQANATDQARRNARDSFSTTHRRPAPSRSPGADDDRKHRQKHCRDHARIKGWESRLSRVIERHDAMPFNYGRSDCFVFVADVVEALTGVRIFAGSRRYKTEAGAARMLRRKGFETVADAFGSLFEEVPVALALRGDIGVVTRNGETGAGAFTSIGFLGRGRERLIMIPRNEVLKAWRVT